MIDKREICRMVLEGVGHDGREYHEGRTVG